MTTPPTPEKINPLPIEAGQLPIQAQTEYAQPTELYKWYERKNFKPINETRAAIIEDYIANDMPIKDLAHKYEITYNQAIYTVGLYFRKPEFTITLLSRV